MPIKRSHKRRLKKVRQWKGENCNKEGKGVRCGGTGQRFVAPQLMENYEECLRDLMMNCTSRTEWFRACEEGDVARPDWLVNHPGQKMESDVHDRTRWPSNKLKSKEKKRMVSEKRAEITEKIY